MTKMNSLKAEHRWCAQNYNSGYSMEGTGESARPLPPDVLETFKSFPKMLMAFKLAT